MWRMRSASSSAPRVGVRQDQPELLAADAAGVVVARSCVQSRLAEPVQHGVALQVAVAVVDALEVVEVEQQQRDRIAVAVAAVELRAQVLVEVAVVQRPVTESVRAGLEGVVGAGAVDRQRGLVGEDLGQGELVVGEVPSPRR